ncbi:cbb3-type cytochrome c oxidase subunit 3 [Psychromarinibacter sp. C21-152]|uniref:Cbb3-type cytochrome c oxidase subunit 3 n=1 Tax=Psychromarinibacter sediminicola TaxID=3033385 RepID=A0AAE3T863_9RHOB|nr:cbb3-type cytochrome c oxidase subunit 3 [Psychromarinibacter sediminicola]MDF0601070.1 cbb3-type cytochrome c oxidase subunit 3 [Psychromarinibacter sediminicola]
MDTYSLLRQLADSWVLLVLFLFFIGVVVWAFRPGSRKTHRDTANIPFRHEDKPAPDDASERTGDDDDSAEETRQ